MCSKIPGCAEPKVQASHVLLRTKRKRNEPLGPDYILLGQKKAKSMVDSLSVALQGTSLSISNDSRGEEGGLMFVRGGTGAHNSQDQNLLSTKFSPLPLPIKEEREETRKRRIGETTTQRFVEVQRMQARAIPSTTLNSNTPSSSTTPHRVGSSDPRFCVIDVVDMGLHGDTSQSEVIPAVEDCVDKQQNWNRRQGDSMLKDDAEQTEEEKEEWVYDIYRLSSTVNSEKQKLLAQSSSQLGIVDLEDVGYASGDEDDELLKCNSELNFVMENDSMLSELSDQDCDKDSNDEDCYQNDYPDGEEEDESDEDQHLVHVVDSETDEEWVSSDGYTPIDTYSPYWNSAAPAAQQAFWTEVESDDDEGSL